MKLTLRKASALQNSIQEAIKTIELKAATTINEFQDANVVLAEANATLVANDKRRNALTKALYTIRGQVGLANATSGVSDRLSDAAYVDKRIGQLQGLISVSVQDDITVIGGKLEKIRNRKEDAHSYYREDVVNTGVLTAEQVEAFKTEQRDLKKRKQKLNDEILELNVRTEVELSDEVVATLNAENLL